MYRGRYTLGQVVPLSVQTMNNSGRATLPASAPIADVFSDSGFVDTFKLPIHDRYAITAYFLHQFRLDSRFSTGRHRVLYRYKIGSDTKLESEEFEIVAGGTVHGQSIALHYFDDPQNRVVLNQTDGGQLLKLRNPRT